jgi:dethiobiotin synthetase
MTPHPWPSAPRGFFVTGTDTGVGKTLISCALLRALARRGCRVVGMKPVAAGASSVCGRLVNEDVTALEAASSIDAPHEWVNPYCFQPAIAPHLAAADARVVIELSRIENAYTQLAAIADCVVVEGAGGFRVPLGPEFDTADLAARLGLPVILVVGMRLGCINHALLSAAAIKAAGLPLAGWVANHIDPDMLHASANVHALHERLKAPLLCRVAYCADLPQAMDAAPLDIDALSYACKNAASVPDH